MFSCTHSLPQVFSCESDKTAPASDWGLLGLYLTFLYRMTNQKRIEASNDGFFGVADVACVTGSKNKGKVFQVYKLWGECWRSDPDGSRWILLKTTLGKENFKKAKRPLAEAQRKALLQQYDYNWRWLKVPALNLTWL